jgi:hypothetical protein
VLGEQDRGQVGGGHGGGRVPGTRLRAGPDSIDPQLLPKLPPEVWATHVGVT